MDPSQFTLPMLPMDPEQVAEMHRELSERNEERDRARTRRANRAAGIKEPGTGDRLYVSPARGIRARSRAGVRFTEDARAKLIVIDPMVPSPEVPAGYVAITPDQAEAILADTSLTTHATSHVEADAAGERARAEQAEQALAAAQRQIASLQEAVAKARREAKDPGDGTSGRLKAAAAARAAHGKKTEEFGSEG